jgi:hypothetical protein
VERGERKEERGKRKVIREQPWLDAGAVFFIWTYRV